MDENVISTSAVMRPTMLLRPTAGTTGMRSRERRKLRLIVIRTLRFAHLKAYDGILSANLHLPRYCSPPSK